MFYDKFFFDLYKNKEVLLDSKSEKSNEINKYSSIESKKSSHNLIIN
jgi:hypothetical protein